MKLLNYTTYYFAVVLFVIMSVWAAIFYYDMLDEIYDSIDDGLDNQKGLVIQQAAVDSTVLRQSAFGERGYAIQQVDSATAINFHDVYTDTTMYMQNEKDHEPVRLLTTVFKQNNRFYRLQVGSSMVEEDDLVAELFYSLLWLYVGLIATILLLNNFLLKRIWKPFYNLMAQLKDFKLSAATTIQPQATKISEFRLLNESLMGLLKSSIDTFNNQKQFIENASHELQTPLAIAINKLEALAESGSLNEEQIALLASSLDHLERLTRLNKSLLLLSRIENRQFASAEEVSVNDVTNKILDDFEDQLSYNNITVQKVEEVSLSVKMNPDLAVILITNLVKNAIIHNLSGGTITIAIKERELRVENTGKDVSLEEDLLFRRFSKQGETGIPSTGLGLAIVKAITDIYGFSVSYSFDRKHALTISFK